MVLVGIIFNDDYTDYSIRVKSKYIVNSNENVIIDFGKNRKSEYIEKKKEQ